MGLEILVIRDLHRYRALHGQLHLTSAMMAQNRVLVAVVVEGKLTVIKIRQGHLVGDSCAACRY